MSEPLKVLQAKHCTVCPLPACIDLEDARCPLLRAFRQYKNASNRRSRMRQAEWQKDAKFGPQLPLWAYGVKGKQ